MIWDTFVKSAGLPMQRASQLARQADGETPLDVIGEVHCQFTRGKHHFQFDGLVVNKLDVDVLAGNPFLARNDIYARPSMRQVIIQGHDVIPYGPQSGNSASIHLKYQQFFLVILLR